MEEQNTHDEIKIKSEKSQQQYKNEPQELDVNLALALCPSSPCDGSSCEGAFGSEIEYLLIL